MIIIHCQLTKNNLVIDTINQNQKYILVIYLFIIDCKFSYLINLEKLNSKVKLKFLTHNKKLVNKKNSTKLNNF